ncbi:nitroreductase family protein [Actinosynnema sp. NPDC047251]|uniref:Nitroreductase domain-containing protein n=1 Tax=Saccharothrix espanaensis (strain ATCC 51144 / DSM 44229 / JCM 9112 / NBRC 15066 / NRRL 15764) TaxID=1179773 RepID=K0JXP5_SACES|nr:nitroreductase family protein [Saccharothrix espanaensis]CCH32675.1 hypothetical protein BN6_54160 [Saccharothrix espanaensis DSM 44229]
MRAFLRRCQLAQSTNAHLAPATFFVTTDADEWRRERGDRAYVDLHLRAGAATTRLLVAASAEGLVARVHNGFLTQPIRDVTGGPSRIAVFAVMVARKRASARYRIQVGADR